jgi:arsenical-resistance protein 2
MRDCKSTLCGHGYSEVMSFPVPEHCHKMATLNDETPWWAAFPDPRSQCASVEAAEVMQLLEKHENDKGGRRDFLLVDVRRSDWTGGTIASSINLPAHSCYPTRQIVHDLCMQAGVKRIIFYCGMY